MTINRKFRTFATLFLLLAGMAVAQVDDRARELLTGLDSGAAPTEVRTMEQQMTMTLHDEGLSTSTRSYIDFENERAAIITETMGMEMVMRYVDGNMSMSMGGMSMPSMPGMDEAFDGIFDDVTFAGLLDHPDAVATYDGMVSYGDILSGQQVSYSGGNLDFAGLGTEMTTVRMIFDESGNLIGQVSPMNGGDLVSVFVGEPVLEGLALFDAELYQLVGDTATPFGTMHYEVVTINEPLDESLFR